MVSWSVLELPEKSAVEQKRSKESWNLEHSAAHPNFYTIGYSGRNLDTFINTLKQAGVVTLVDIRFTPLSRFKPEFSKNNLKKDIETHGI
ncbi:MAG: DUF488 domain-containing protein, partial [Chloroflexota bacterium]|nr:DUF488 domain-containing protein [Chloroflexota bacterium]